MTARSELRLLLHDLVCASGGSACSLRKEHSKTTDQWAKSILASRNPAEAIHAKVCVAALHHDHYRIGPGCSNPVEHAAALSKQVGL